MTGFVYAIGDQTGLVKIGWSEYPFERLATISSTCSSAVTLLGVVPATQSQELEAHALLSRWRVHHEWFRHEGPVAAFVSMLAKPKEATCQPNLGSEINSLPNPLGEEIPEGIIVLKTRPRRIDPDVSWAAAALRNIAGMRPIDEKLSATIQRVAARLGFSYWRTFDLWYRKARQLEGNERAIITAAITPSTL